MDIKLYDKVKLKNGYFAYIVDILDSENFVADIDYDGGIDTDFINIKDIA